MEVLERSDTVEADDNRERMGKNHPQGGALCFPAIPPWPADN
ncbi:MAG: hypothetical protein Q7K29_05720 [Thermoleophilia bacterium]|nr:hypothetical protein [Thermoleophilia bacterium]